MSDWLFRGLRWLVHKIGVETLFYFGLLLLILWATLNSLQQIVQGFDLELMALIGVSGLVGGWLLARSRLTAGWGLIAVLLLGIGWVIWLVGHLSPQAWIAVQAASRYFLSWLAWRPGTAFPTSEGLLAAMAGLGTGLTALLGRVISWIGSALKASPIFDPVAAAVVWGLAVWLVSAWSAWSIRRWQKPLWALAPSTALVGVSLASVGGSTYSFLIILASVLTMLGWNSYRQQESRWLRLRIDFSDDLRLDTALALIAIVMSLTSIAAITPSVSLQKLVDWTDRLNTTFRSRAHPSGGPVSGSGQNAGPASTYEPGLTFGESLGLEPEIKTPKPNSLDELRASGGLPQQHLLGSGPELSEQIVLKIQDESGAANEAGNPAEPAGPHRYYWRAVTYDRYSGQGWSTGPTRTIDYPAEERAMLGGLTAQLLIRQEVQVVGAVLGGGSIFFSPGELLAASYDYQIAWRHFPEGTQDGSDQYGVLARPADRPPHGYRIEALVSQASQDQLRTAGSQYPDWVLENDLLLPETLPNRVRKLALDLTATKATPFDRAQAIETYLRTYPYTLDLDVPPGDRDLVDYFLFDLKKGYCDYYASSMVVMARAAGIPARLVVGYVSSSYDPDTGVYQISAAEAHSWPELYFPGYGWIGFEPTAGRPALERSEAATSLQAPQWSGERANFMWRIDWLRLGYILLGCVAATLLGWLVWNAGETWWLERLPGRPAVVEIYRRLYRSGHRLQMISHPGDTPDEFGQILIGRIGQIDPNHGLPGQQIRQITGAYATLIYSTQFSEEALKHRAIQNWRLVRRSLWIVRLKWFAARIRRFFLSK